MTVVMFSQLGRLPWRRLVLQQTLQQTDQALTPRVWGPQATLASLSSAPAHVLTPKLPGRASPPRRRGSRERADESAVAQTLRRASLCGRFREGPAPSGCGGPSHGWFAVGRHRRPGGVRAEGVDHGGRKRATAALLEARPSAPSAKSSTVQYSPGRDGDEKNEKKPPPPPPAAAANLDALKVQVKQVQEMQQQSKGWMVRIWSAGSKIGPAIKAVASMSRHDWGVKIAGWKKAFWLELQHYWIGSKLLWADVKISSRLLLKLAGGTGLTRRERHLVTRTSADITRLVPFVVIVVVPFMEFLLPVLLKVFPNMLPSHFKDKTKEREQLKKNLTARVEYAKFLQDMVAEMAKELKTTHTGDLLRTAEDLDGFMTKVRTGGSVATYELLHFAKLFNDELTLDNISRPRLVSMCKYMNIQPYGTDAYLRFSLRNKLNWIKQDDRMIQSEGVDSLSEAELRAACRERGMLGLLSVEQMRVQLRDWLDLSLTHSVPSSLLILSRAFMVAGRTGREEAVQATLSSLPEEVIASVDVKTQASEMELEEQKKKLKYLEQQEDLIKEDQKGSQGGETLTKPTTSTSFLRSAIHL